VVAQMGGCRLPVPICSHLAPPWPPPSFRPRVHQPRGGLRLAGRWAVRHCAGWPAVLCCAVVAVVLRALAAVRAVLWWPAGAALLRCRRPAVLWWTVVH